MSTLIRSSRAESSRVAAFTVWKDFPNELRQRILKQLSPIDLINFAATQRQAQVHITQNGTLWNRHGVASPWVTRSERTPQSRWVARFRDLPPRVARYVVATNANVDIFNAQRVACLEKVAQSFAWACERGEMGDIEGMGRSMSAALVLAEEGGLAVPTLPTAFPRRAEVAARKRRVNAAFTSAYSFLASLLIGDGVYRIDKSTGRALAELGAALFLVNVSFEDSVLGESDMGTVSLCIAAAYFCGGLAGYFARGQHIALTGTFIAAAFISEVIGYSARVRFER